MDGTYTLPATTINPYVQTESGRKNNFPTRSSDPVTLPLGRVLILTHTDTKNAKSLRSRVQYLVQSTGLTNVACKSTGKKSTQRTRGLQGVPAWK